VAIKSIVVDFIMNQTKLLHYRARSFEASSRSLFNWNHPISSQRGRNDEVKIIVSLLEASRVAVRKIRPHLEPG
jgi:hypothetical protein